MPRRKRTNAGRSKALSKPRKADESDLSICSMTSEAPLSKDEILSRLMEEVQFSVQNKIAQMRAMMNKAITDQRNLLKMELLKIPKDIRKMKVSEFISAGGDMDELMANVANPVEESVPPFESLSKAVTVTQQTASTSKRAATARKTRVAKTPMAPPAVPQTGGRTTRGAKARAVNAIKDQMATDMVTPARGIPSIPIITPRVPPSACMTAGRKPKKGGELTFSLDGSPVASLPKGSDLINLSLKDGKKFDVSGAILDMSPNSLVIHAEKLSQFKDFVETKLQQIEKTTGYLSTVKKPRKK